MTDDEKLRAEISAQVFDGQQPAAPAPEPDKPELKSEPQEPVETVQPEEVPVDEWAGVSPALRKTVEALQAKVGDVDSLQERLKQAERRLGAATNELSELKKKPEPVEPTEGEKTKKFREEYPELSESVGGTLDERIAAARAEMLAKVPTIDEKTLTESIAKTVKAELAYELAIDRVEEAHPGWQQKKESPEFKAWHAEAKDVPRVATTAREAIRLMDAYEAFKKTQKTPAEIEAARQKRLEQAQTTQGRKLPVAKSEADMTPAELRAHIAAQVFAQP